MIYKQLQHYNGIRANNSHVIHASKLGLGSYDQSQNLILNSLCLFIVYLVKWSFNADIQCPNNN